MVCRAQGQHLQKYVQPASPLVHRKSVLKLFPRSVVADDSWPVAELREATCGGG
jgi:hypothetical protein